MKRIPRRLLTALTAAYWKKKPKLGLQHHSGRGGQYCSAAYRALQASYAMQTSMSRKGNGWEFASRRHLHAVQTRIMRRWKVSLARLKLKVCLIMVSTPESRPSVSFLNRSKSFITACDATQK